MTIEELREEYKAKTGYAYKRPVEIAWYIDWLERKLTQKVSNVMGNEEYNKCLNDKECIICPMCKCAIRYNLIINEREEDNERN